MDLRRAEKIPQGNGIQWVDMTNHGWYGLFIREPPPPHYGFVEIGYVFETILGDVFPVKKGFESRAFFPSCRILLTFTRLLPVCRY